MSSNFFAALDDSGDEAPSPKATKKKTVKVVEPSKTDDRKRPNHNDRNTKYGRGGRAPTRDGKRAYDRRSGTGRGKEIKKGGGGAHNWGNDKNDAARAAEEHHTMQDNEEEEAANSTKGVVEKESPAPPVVDNTISYEEYLQNKKTESGGLLAPVKERRVDENEFANLMPSTATKNQEEDFLVMGGGKQKRKKTGKTVDTKATTELLSGMKVSSRAGGGRDKNSNGRGGRGGGSGRSGGGRGRGGGSDGRGRGRSGRDGRGRGRDGGGRSSSKPGRNSLNMLDESAFPSL